MRIEDVRKAMADSGIVLDPWQLSVLEYNLWEAERSVGLTIEARGITPSVRRILVGGPTKNPIAGAARQSTRWTHGSRKTREVRRVTAQMKEKLRNSLEYLQAIGLGTY